MTEIILSVCVFALSIICIGYGLIIRELNKQISTILLTLQTTTRLLTEFAARMAKYEKMLEDEKK